MAKALIVGCEGADFASLDEAPVAAGSFNSATEASTQYSATEGATFSLLRARNASGTGSGTNIFKFRDAGADGNQTFSFAGAGSGEDATNTDALTAGDLFNIAYTDNGTNSTMEMVAMNVEFASGHGNFHGASAAGALIYDLASTTSYLPISGQLVADGTTTIANVQWKNRGYTSIEAIQVRISANARVNDSTLSVNVNGSDTGTAITIGAGVTGLLTATGLGISIADGDLVCLSLTLDTGTTDLTLVFVGATLKSTNNESEVFSAWQTGVARAASSTADYFLPGGQLTADATETTQRVKVGFAARCRNLRCYLSANTYGGAATLKLMVNGAAQITTTIGAGGGAAWYENTSDTFDIDDNDEISFEIDEGTSGSITIHAIGVTFDEIPAGGVTGTVAQTLPKPTQALSGKETISGTVAQTAPKPTQAAAGTVTLAGVSGTVAQTLPFATQALVGTSILDATGTIAQTLPMITQALAGTGGESEPAEEQRPTGGFDTWRSYHRVQAELRRRRAREREELEITEAEQRAIDRAAKKIARTMPGVGLDAPLEARQAVLAAPAFDALLMALRPSEGEIQALAAAIVERIAWMMAEQEEEEAIVRLMMEMD